MNENDALYYTVRVGESPYSDSLKIDAKGLVTFLSTNNFQPGTPPEIGFYQLQLTVDDVETLWQTVEMVKFEEVDTSAAMPDEGEGTRVITVVKDNNTVAKLVGQRDSAPTGFKELEEKLRDVGARVRQEPVSALQMGVSLTQQELRHDETLEIVIRFSNPGRDPIVFANPLYVETLHAGFFELDVLRSDIPLQNLRDHHRFNHRLNYSNLTLIEPSESRDKEVIELIGGSAVQITLRIIISWPAGEYNLQILFACQKEKIKKDEVLVGEIDSLPLPIKVVP
jgi:hypothetical protein